VIGLTKHVAREVAAYGVTVNATAPSTTLSSRVEAIYADGGASLSAAHPTGRLATPEEQAAAIVFLCSPEASYVNGACLDVTGGSVNIECPAPSLHGRKGRLWCPGLFSRPSSSTWDDIAWLRSQWDGPFMVEGVSRVSDARRAVDAGASAISVSDHGGNNLDGGPASI
jgi:hypothetical protein